MRESPLFSGLREVELEAVAEVMTRREFPKGSFMPARNECGAVLYVLVSGRVKATIVSPLGKELALSYVEAPAFLGDLHECDDDHRRTDRVAMTDVEALSLNVADLTRVIGVHPQLALEIIAAFSARVIQLTARLEDMAFHDAVHRVKRVILNIATAAYESRGVPLVEGFTHYEIATLAGTSRETASRVISNLARDGLVATKGRKIVVDLLGLLDALGRDDTTR